MTKGEADAAEDSPHREVRLNQVFNKITSLIEQQQAQAVNSGGKAKAPRGVIESILPTELNTNGKYRTHITQKISLTVEKCMKIRVCMKEN